MDRSATFVDVSQQSPTNLLPAWPHSGAAAGSRRTGLNRNSGPACHPWMAGPPWDGPAAVTPANVSAMHIRLPETARAGLQALVGATLSRCAPSLFLRRFG